MAYLQNSNNDDKENQQGQPSTQPVNISGTQATGTGSQPSPSNSSGTPTSSGRFTNIQSYLKANEGYNKDNGGFAGKIYGDLSDKEKQNENEISNNFNDFQNTANQNRKTYSDDYEKQVFSDPSKYLSDSNNLNKWQDLTSGNYNAATFDPNAKLSNNINNFNTLTGLTGSETGRKSLLQNLYGKPGYNQGQQSLDNLFLQSNPTQLQQLNKAGDLSNQLQNKYQSFVKNASDLNAQYAQEAKDTAGKLKSDLSSDIEKEKSDLENRVKQASQQRGFNYEDFVNKVRTGNINNADINRLGVNPEEGWFGVDPTQFIKMDTTPITTNNVANANDYAKFQALEKLSGQSNLANLVKPAGSLGDGIVIGQNQAGQSLAQAVNAAKTNYNNDLNKILGDIINTSHLDQYIGNSGSTNHPVANPNALPMDIGRDPNKLLAALEQHVKPLAAGNTPGVKTVGDYYQDQINALKSLMSKYGVKQPAQAQPGALVGGNPFLNR